MTDETVPIIREIAQFMVELVDRHLSVYERPHFAGGKMYDVIVRLHTDKDDTQPMRPVDGVGDD